MKLIAKRWLCSLLACVLILGSLPVLALAQEADETVIASGNCGWEGDNLTWVLTDDGVLTISGSGKMANYSNTNVSPWYSHRTKITSVVIKAGVTSIGENAFYDCSSLASVSIPDSVSSIGNYAFRGCSSLTSVSIPDGVTSIGRYVFYGCSSLASISIPDSVTSIGTSAFRNCSSLTSVSIPDSVSSIGSYAFYGCSSLTSVSIPEGVTSIGDSAFSVCSSLTSVSIPDSVTSIGTYAFSGCSSLASVSIPEGVTSIGSGAFYGCSSLTSVSIPDSVTSIGDSAFYGCSSLTSVSIPEGGTSIGDSAFSGCSSLASISIPDGVTSIGTYAFSGCSNLTSVSIPAGVTSIENSTFTSCSSLTSVSIPDGVTSIGTHAFFGCFSLASVSIPDSVTSIGSYAFSCCTSLTSVSIPEGVTSIENYTFSDCSSLASVSIPQGVTSIGEYAFFWCNNLTKVYFRGDGFTGTDDIFNNAVTAYYPRGNTTWTEAIRDSFGSKVIWVEACTGGMAHTEVIDAAKEPTCTETGLTEGKHCSVCNDILVAQNIVSAKGHTEVIDAAVAATCTETGLTAGSHCSVCDVVLVEQTVIPTLGHAWNTPNCAEAATCTREGCGATRAAGEHVWGDWTVTKEATCTETGVKTYTCASCGETKTEEIPTASHTYGEDGTCTVCGASRSEAGPETCSITLHYDDTLCTIRVIDGNTQSSENPTVFVSGNGQSASVPSGSWAIFDITNIKSGYRIGSVTLNGTDRTQSFVNGTYGGLGISNISTDYALTAVMEEIPDTLPSVTSVTLYTDSAGTQPAAENITYTSESTKARLYGKATFSDGVEYPVYYAMGQWQFSTDGTTWQNTKCWGSNRFDFWPGWQYHEELDFLNASYDIRLKVNPQDLYTTGSSVYSNVIHINGGASGSGTSCDHNWGEWTTTEATCTQDGSRTHTCAVCGKTETQTIPATGHTEVTDAAVAATCTETGLTEGKHCSVCKDVLVAQEVVSAKGHTPGGWEHNSTQHWRVCTICKNALDRAEHTYSDDTCTVCDYSKVTPFVDVPTNAYYFNAVQWAVENKITAGTSDTTFSPDAPCTRAQAVSFLWRAAGRPTPTSSQMAFTDVTPDSYYRTAVLWAVENKITSGTSATTFSPDATCTRGQIVSFLCRAFGEPGSANTSFTDVAPDAYYAGAVSWAVANGVTAGTGDGKFSPDADCTRGQIVSFLYRCRDKM